MRRALLGAALGFMLAAAAAAAQEFPAKPIRLIVPFAPGGTTDLLARVVADQLSADLKRQVIVDNKPGAGSTLGADLVAKSPPDGYTLSLSNAASHGVAPGIYRVLPYDADRDFAHVALIGIIPQLFVVNPTVPAASIADFVALAKARPGQLNFATAGNGSIGHLAGELFKSVAGIDLVHIPYRGTAPAAQDLLAGRVQVAFQNAPEAAPHIRAGTLKLLAVTSAARLDMFPEVPTFRESGMDALVTSTWYGISAPAGTPPAIVELLNAAINRRLAEPAVRSRLIELGITPEQRSAAAYQSFVGDEVAKFTRISRAANITID